MTNIEQAIKEAVEKGGYFHPGDQHIENACWQITLLDPLFWQALGKARGWKDYKDGPLYIHATEQQERDAVAKEWLIKPFWLFMWHRFIEHLAEGKDAESFFATLQSK